ncbi:MAG: CRTAC1 family protein [Acidobacteriota bacterium]
MISIGKVGCIVAALFCIFIEITAGAPAGKPARFLEVGREAGLTKPTYCGSDEKSYIIETVGTGAAFLDFDQDGDLDIFLVNGGRLEGFPPGEEPHNLLYRNDGDGRFVDVTDAAGVGDTRWGQGVSYGDFDNDGDDDLYVTNWGANLFYRNNGDGTFTDITEKTGTGDPSWGASSAFGDYDNDGDLDLFVANYLEFDPEKIPKPGESRFCKWMGVPVMCGPRGLTGSIDRLYKNMGDGTFLDVTSKAGLHTEKGFYGLGAIFSDYDLDGDLDLYVANDSEPNFLYRNNGNGTFTDVGYRSGVSFNEEGREQAGMGVDFGDYDNDGDLDLFVTNFSQDSNTLYENLGNGLFADKTYILNLGAPTLLFLGWGAGFLDFDNDGYRDLFVANGHVYPQIDRMGTGSTYLQKNQLFRNLQGKRFQEITGSAGPGFQVSLSSRGSAIGDYDNDGDLDILVVNMNAPPSLLRNEEGNRNPWIRIQLRGTRSNRNGFGAKIRVEIGGRTWFSEARGTSSILSQGDSRVHFGLGPGTKSVEMVEISWPSGIRQVIRNLEVNRQHTIEEPLEGNGVN